MKPTYDPAVRDQIRQRMSPPNRESVADIARSTGIAAPTLYSWRHRWKLEGQLVPASSKAPEQWSAADKLAAVIHSLHSPAPNWDPSAGSEASIPNNLPVGAK